ncbi:MAG: hypothetical protein JHC93_06455 [Parachlamydiales bacterium]|nr:hypothetical protein [Parachlamydiales bacterium]
MFAIRAGFLSKSLNFAKNSVKALNPTTKLFQKTVVVDNSHYQNFKKFKASLCPIHPSGFKQTKINWKGYRDMVIDCVENEKCHKSLIKQFQEELTPGNYQKLRKIIYEHAFDTHKPISLPLLAFVLNMSDESKPLDVLSIIALTEHFKRMISADMVFDFNPNLMIDSVENMVKSSNYSEDKVKYICADYFNAHAANALIKHFENPILNKLDTVIKLYQRAQIYGCKYASDNANALSFCPFITNANAVVNDICNSADTNCLNLNKILKKNMILNI